MIDERQKKGNSFSKKIAQESQVVPVFGIKRVGGKIESVRTDEH